MGGETGSKKQLGKIMLQQKLVTPEQLKELVVEQKRSGERLASVATRQGEISIPEALSALAEQHGIPPADMGQLRIELSLLNLVPKDVAFERRVLPFALEGERLSVAMASPDDSEALEELGFLTAKEIVPHVALDAALLRTIEAAYAAIARGETSLDCGKLDLTATAEEPAAPATLPTPPPPAPAGSPIAVSIPAAPVVEETGAAAASRAAAPRPAAAAAAGQHAPPTPAAEPVAPAPDPAPAQPAAVAVPMPPGAAAPAPQAADASADGLVTDGQAPASLGHDLDAAFTDKPTPSIMPSKQAYDEASVLLANTVPELRSELRESLEASGIPVAEIESGRGVLDRLKDSRPNLLLLDTELMEMSGFDVCRRLRNSPELASLPIIMTSARHRGWRFEADLRECFRIRHYFEAPIDVPELTRTIRLELEGEEVIPIPVELGSEVQAQLDSSMEAFERGDLDAAISHLEAGTRMTPESFRLQYHLGLLYGRRGDLFLAITTLEHAVEQRPRHFSALKNLAVVYQRVGFRYRAIETWQRAMWCSPDDATQAGIKEHVAALL